MGEVNVTAQLTSPILVRSTILVALAIAWIRAPVAAIRLPIMLDFQSTAKSVGANLEGIPSTAAPIAVAMLEIPGLNITVHAIQSTSATEILNGTSSRFGINTGGSADQIDYFDFFWTTAPRRAPCPT